MAGKVAFTLAEILLALGLISIVILTILGLSIRSLHVNRKNMDTTVGQMVANQALERLVYEAEHDSTAPVWANNSATIPFSNTQVTMGDTAFNVSIFASDALSTPGSRLKRLKSQVIWSDAPQGKVGKGVLRVEATRLVHEP